MRRRLSRVAAIEGSPTRRFRWSDMANHIGELTPDPRNARRHTSRNVGQIVNALHEVGAARSIVIDEDGVILAGNATVEAAAQAGIERLRIVDADGEEIIAVRRTGLTPEQKTRLALADNRAAELAEWDVDTLAELSAEVDLSGFWSEDELAALLGTPKPVADDPGAQVDRAEELREKWQTERGQLWQVGRHRLLCGDSTNADDVARLMAGERAELTFTDPPYNVGKNYGDSVDDARQDYAEFSLRWFRQCPSDCITFTPGMVNLALWYELVAPTWLCSWRKSNQMSPSALQGFNVWEPVIVYGKPAKPVGHDAWDMPVVIHTDAGALHPVPKSDEAWRTILDALATSSALVYEPFTGSGTTQLACEQTGRICYGMEIEPKYVAVALERLTGLGLDARRLD